MDYRRLGASGLDVPEMGIEGYALEAGAAE